MFINAGRKAVMAELEDIRARRVVPKAVMQRDKSGMFLVTDATFDEFISGQAIMGVVNPRKCAGCKLYMRTLRELAGEQQYRTGERNLAEPQVHRYFKAVYGKLLETFGFPQTYFFDNGDFVGALFGLPANRNKEVILNVATYVFGSGNGNYSTSIP